MNRTLDSITAVAATIIFFSIASPARAEIVGYTFFGPNLAYSAKPDAVGGGYFTFNASSLPLLVDNRYTYSPAGMWGAVDDDLCDEIRPGYVFGSFADNGQFNYNFGGSPNLTVYTNGQAPAISQSLGAMFASSGGVQYIVGAPTTAILDRWLGEPTITQIDPMEMLDDGISITDVGGVMEAKFTPDLDIGGFELPVKLEDAAALLGYDHFNWVQWVTEDNGRRPTAGGVLPPVPYIDPPHGGWDYQQPWGADHFDGYWNEGPGYEPGYSVADNKIPSTPSDDPMEIGLKFEDAPTVEPGHRVLFKTALAGVVPILITR